MLRRKPNYRRMGCAFSKLAIFATPSLRGLKRRSNPDARHVASRSSIALLRLAGSPQNQSAGAAATFRHVCSSQVALAPSRRRRARRSIAQHDKKYLWKNATWQYATSILLANVLDAVVATGLFCNRSAEVAIVRAASEESGHCVGRRRCSGRWRRERGLVPNWLRPPVTAGHGPDRTGVRAAVRMLSSFDTDRHWRRRQRLHSFHFFRSPLQRRPVVCRQRTGRHGGDHRADPIRPLLLPDMLIP